METPETINARVARLESGLNEAFGVKAKSLEKALRKTGRRLPRRLRTEAGRIVDAQGMGGNPKLAKRIDSVALDVAEARLSEYLSSIDRADARKGRLISLAATIAFNVLIVIAAFIIWMVWTGKL